MLHNKEAEFDTLGFLDFYIVLTKVEGISNIKDYAQVKLALNKLVVGLSANMLSVIANGIGELKKLLGTNLVEYKQAFNINGLNAFVWLQEVAALSEQDINEYAQKFGTKIRGKVLLEAYNTRFSSIEKQLSAGAASDEDETILGFYALCRIVEENRLLEFKDAIIGLLKPFLLKIKRKDSLFRHVERLNGLLLPAINHSLFDQYVESDERETVHKWIKFFMAIPLGEVSLYLYDLVEKIGSSLKEKENQVPIFINNTFIIFSRSEEIDYELKDFPSVSSFNLQGFWELYAALTKLPFLERFIIEDTHDDISGEENEEYSDAEDDDEVNSTSDESEDDEDDEEGEESGYRSSLSMDYIQLDNDYRKIKYAITKVLTSLIIANQISLALPYFSEIKRLIDKHKTFFEQTFSSDSLHFLGWMKEISSKSSTQYIKGMRAEFHRIYKVSDAEKAQLLPSFLKQKANEVKYLPSELEIICGTINTLAFYHFYAFITQRPELSRYIKNFQELRKTLDQFIESMAEEIDSASIFFARVKKMVLDNKPAFLSFNYQSNVKLLQWVLQLEKVTSLRDAEYFTQLNFKIKLDVNNYSIEHKGPKSQLIQEILAKETRAILRSLPEVNSSTPEFSKALAGQNRTLKGSENPRTFMLNPEALQETDPELFAAMRNNEQIRMRALFQDDILVENYQIYRSPQGIKRIPVYYVTTEERVFQTFLLYFTNHLNRVQKMLTSEGFVVVGKKMLDLFEKRILKKKEEIERYKSEHGREPLNVYILFNDEQLTYAKENLLSIIRRVEEQVSSIQQRSHEELTSAVDKYRFGGM